MPWNGSGTYSLPPAYSPEVNGTIIDAARYNGLTSDVATGLTACLAKNGENAATANLPMGGFKHTGAAAANASGQYLLYGQSSGSLASLGIGAGLVGTPSLFITGNTNTGIWSPGSNILAMSAAGAEIFRFSAAGLLSSMSNPRHSLRDSAAGASSMAQTISGLELISGDMNTTAKYTSALKFGSTDTNFTTTNPKFGAVIVGEATQTYSLDTTGGMALAFFTQPDNPGAAGDLRERMRLGQDGGVSILAPDAGIHALTITAVSGAMGIVQEHAISGGAVQWRLENTSNTASSQAILQIIVAGSSASDPYINFNVEGIQGWSAGIDNSASDVFKITSGTNLNAGDGLTIFPDGRIAGSALHNNAGAVTGTTNQYIASGTFTPTFTAGTNVDTVTADGDWTWIRVGNVVTYFGGALLNCTAGGGASTGYEISLPIASDFTTGLQASGTVVQQAAGTTYGVGVVNSSAANNRLAITLVSQSAVEVAVRHSTQYLIL